MLVGGLAYSIFWPAVVHGGTLKLAAPSDLWDLAGSSSALIHGHFSHIYVHNGALTSPPAFEFLLAPVILFGQLLGLTVPIHQNGGPIGLWFVLGPAAIFLGSSALFAIDAVARYWQFSERDRLLLALTGGAAVANVVVGWGHPEDCLALALLLWAALALERDEASATPRAALLLGAAIACQPFAVLGVAPILARLGWPAAARVSWRLALPSLLVLVPPLIGEGHRTLEVLIRQPFQPKFISYTPLTHWAPSISPGVLGGGPTRLVATVAGVILSVAVCRRRFDLATVLGMTAVAIFLRLLLETELNWYYFWPVAALCLLLARRGSWTRFSLCAASVLVSMVLGNHRVHNIDVWWPAMMALTVVMLSTVLLPLWTADRSRPGRRVRRHESVGEIWSAR
jgi:hypothetical protein